MIQKKILCIGDPHFKTTNIVDVDLFLKKIKTLAQEKQPDLIVILGDVLDTHERLHTTALNKAYELVEEMRKIALTYVLVGNHDMICNQQFLSTNHWMNGMKKWDNVVIVDKVETLVMDTNVKLVFVPYVYPGRFEEAINTIQDDWKQSDCIFAHQEFEGCKMGAIVSKDGDKWSLTNPPVISGHIHSNQTPQENIYYPGSAMQHAFGESSKNIIAYIEIEAGEKYVLEEIDLNLPRKKIVYMNVEDVEDYSVVEGGEDKVKLTISGNYEQFKTFRKTTKYSDIIEKGVKIVFKPKKLDLLMENEVRDKMVAKNSIDFGDILKGLIDKSRDVELLKSWEYVVNGKEKNDDLILFL